MWVIVYVIVSYKGYFEFCFCLYDEFNIMVIQECLDWNLLLDFIIKGIKFFVDDKSVGIYQFDF